MTKSPATGTALGRLLSGILSNWVSVLTSIVVTFFLSPFVVRKLGTAGYGVWILIGSTVGYMVLLDLGLRGAVVRFVSAGHAIGDHEASSRAFTAALVVRTGIAMTVLIATVALALLVNRLFLIPRQLAVDAPLVVLLSGGSVALSLLSGVFGAVVAARQRYDLLSGSAILRTMATAIGTVYLLNAGYGIVALGYLQLAVAVGIFVQMVMMARRAYPELKIVRERPERSMLWDLWQYSAYLFLITLSGSLIYQADAMVVGAVVSAEAVTLFVIGGRLIDYHRQFTSSMAQVFTPVASSLGARGKTSELVRLLFQGTRAALLVGWPIEIVLFIRGETFIALWMGHEFASMSAAVLRVLLLSNFFIVGNAVSANICFGLGRHRPYALWQCGEAVANIILSVALAHAIGTIGVAWGTTIPSLITQAIIWPVYICRVLGVSLTRYVWDVWVRTAVALAPFVAATIAAEYYWPATSLAGFFFQVVCLLPVIIPGVVACYWTDVRAQLANRNSMLRRALRSAMGGG